MNEQFLLNRRERNGFYLLLCLIFLGQCCSIYIKTKKIEHAPEIYASYLTEPTTVLNHVDQQSNQTTIEKNANQKPKRQLKPTTVDKNKKRSFRTVGDTLPPDRTKFKRSVPSKNTSIAKVSLIELNNADSIEIQKVKGIGKVLSKRIIKYRDLIGGFVNKEQLKDVYGIDQERYDQIVDQIVVDHSFAQRYNIFTSSVRELSSHFFISYGDAKILKGIAYSAIASVITIDEILNADGIDRARLEKAIPYLDLQKQEFGQTTKSEGDLPNSS